MSKIRLNRNVITISTLKDNSDDEYWHAKSPLERLQGLQINRQVAFGESNASGRLQRILEVIRR